MQPKDLTGNVYGKLTVISRNIATGSKQITWLCQCECGNTCNCRRNRLVSGYTWHCGCVPSKQPMDLTGQRFGRLVAVKLAPKIDSRNRWECFCDCGNSVIISMGDLRNGNTQSCGCLHSDITRNMMLTHGQATGAGRSGSYRSWISMKQRVNDKNNKCYGGRGISIDDNWLQFENFYKDMGDRPKGCSIDRIDYNGNYEKSNCRWATRKEQNNNKRNNLRVYWRGQVKTIREWADIQGLSQELLYKRIYTHEWDIDRAMLQPHRFDRS